MMENMEVEEGQWKKSLHLQCQLPKVRRSCVQSIQRSDIQARSNFGNDVDTCQVCQDGMEGRYTCPKCNVLYCSVNCYRQHNINCTEDFYRTCVSQYQKLQSKEEMKPLKLQHPTITNFDDDEDEEWMELAQELVTSSSMQDWDEILQRYPISVQEQLHTAFQQSLPSTNTIKPWHPFWLPNYTVTNDNTHDSIDGNEEEEEDNLDADDIHWNIPPFHTLYSNPNNNQSLPQLQYNTVELLYWIAFVLRRYNGFQDIDDDLAQDAIDCLLSSSQVLSNKLLRLENIAQVLLLPTENHYHYETHLNKDERDDRLSIQMRHVLDVWYIMSQKQMIVRTLLRGRQLLLSSSSSKSKKKKKRRQKITFMVKKLEFYTSWCQEYFASSTNCETIQNEMYTWVMDWSQHLDPKLHSEIQEQMILPTTQQQGKEYALPLSSNNTKEEEKTQVIESRNANDPEFLFQVASTRRLSNKEK